MIQRKIFLIVCGFVVFSCMTTLSAQVNVVQELTSKIETCLQNTAEGGVLVKNCEHVIQCASQEVGVVTFDKEFLKIIFLGLLEGMPWPIFGGVINGTVWLDTLVTGIIVALSARVGSWPKLELNHLLTELDVVVIPAAYLATYLAVTVSFALLVGFYILTGLGESLIPIKNPRAERNFEIVMNMLNKLLLASIPLYKRYRRHKNLSVTPKTFVITA